MMKRSHTSIFTLVIAISALMLLMPAQATHAQGLSGKKIAATNKDTIPLLRNVAVSADLVGPIQLMVSDYGQYEAALRVNLKDKYFPVVEIGIGKADGTDESTQINYKTTAPYGRIGCDFNLLRNKHDIYRLYGGVRYALTYFKYDLKGPDIQDPIWGGTTPYEVNGVKCNYHWAEFVFGVDAKIWGPVRMGWSLRYKRRLFHDDGDYGNTWYVPGFGKQGGSRFGGTFNVSFEL